MPGTFDGINRRVSRADLAEGESPDLCNCGFVDGRIGSLGPRKGRYCVTPQAYNDVVLGINRYALPSGTARRIIGTNGGDAIDAPANASGPTTYLTGNTATGKAVTPSSLTITNPATSGTALSTFDDSSTFDPQNSLFASWGYAIATTGSGAWSGTKPLLIKLGLNIGGTALYLHETTLTLDFSAAFTLSGSTPAAMHNALGTITGMAASLSWPSGWPTGAGAGNTVVISSFLCG